MSTEPWVLVSWTFFAICWAGVGFAGSTVGSDPTPSRVAVISTCPSQTINYITQTLPQQCLRTDWTRNATTIEPGVDSAGRVGPARTKASLIESGAPAGFNALTGGAQVLQPSSGTSSAHDAPTKEPSSSAAEPDLASPPDQEEDPFSDGANFVSFEEWKAQMLKKAGQSPEDLGASRSDRSGQEGRRQPPPIHQALDALGDDTEIELDFVGFGSTEEIPTEVPRANLPPPVAPDRADDDAAIVQQTKLSREAGKTSRERFNYASFDCAATILKTNPECKGSSSILMDNKDRYMLSPCSASNKFFIVELCNDILIDTIALGNYEFFSSTFRQFRVSISDRYPVKLDKWREIGVFEAQNTRGIQAFLIKNGLIWARYLRIEFLSHYGAEYYCPVSLLRVHGKTMMDDYRNDVKAARGEDDSEDYHEAEAEGETEAVMVLQDELTGPELADKSSDEASVNEPSQTQKDTEFVGISVMSTNITTAPPYTLNCRGPGSYNDTCPRTNYLSPLLEQTHLVNSGCARTAKFCNMELTQRIKTVSRAQGSRKDMQIPTPLPAFKDFDPPRIAATAASIAPDPTKPAARTPDPKPTRPPTASAPKLDSVLATQSTSGPVPSSNTTETAKIERASSSNVGSSNATNGNVSVPSATSSSGTSSTKTHTQAAPASTPSTQESFFKSVHKRLQLLEANSTLSLQYIEEQSRLLREAFTKVEKRQLNKTSSFLSSLNETVLSELREFRTQYDQIWQSTILELSSQREQSINEAAGLSARLAILADEVVWQKRLVYLQFGLILLCLGLFAFSRTPAGAASQPYLEIPHLRDMLMRSPPSATLRRGRFRSGTEISVRHGLETPMSSPSRPNSRHGITWAKSEASDDGESDGGLKSADGTSDSHLLTPPVEGESKNGLLKPELVRTDSLAPDVVLRRAVSSPVLAADALVTEADNDEPAKVTQDEKLLVLGLGPESLVPASTNG